MNISNINKKLNQKLNHNQNINTKDDSLMLDILTGASRSLKLKENEFSNALSNKEYFFLSELREKSKKIKDQRELSMLAKEYNINNEELDMLFKKHKIIKYDNTLSYSDKIRLGFISKLSSSDSAFLRDLQKHKHTDGSDEFRALQIKHGVTDRAISSLKRNGHLFILNEKENEWASNGKSLNRASEYSISKNRAVEILNHIDADNSLCKIKIADIKIRNYVVKHNEDPTTTIRRCDQALGYTPKESGTILLEAMKLNSSEHFTSKRSFDKILEFKISNKRIPQQEIADLIAFSISESPEDFLGVHKYSQMKELFPNGLDFEKIKEFSLKPNESLFLFELGISNLSSNNEVIKLMSKYEISQINLDKYKKQKLIVSNDESFRLEIVKKLTPFLNQISLHKAYSGTEIFEQIRQGVGINYHDLYTASKLGIVDIVSSNEMEWINRGAIRDNASSFQVSKNRADLILSSDNFEQLRSNESLFIQNKYSKEPPIFLVNYKECDEHLVISSLCYKIPTPGLVDKDSLILLRGNSEGLKDFSNSEKLTYLSLLSNNRSISIQDYSDILAMRLSDLYDNQFTTARENYIKECSLILENNNSEILKNATLRYSKNLPTNEELFFLGKLKSFEFSGIDENKLLALLVQHNLTIKNFDNLKNNGLIEYPSKDMSRNYLISKGYINVIGSREKKFIEEAIALNSCRDSNEFKALKSRFQITDSELKRLESNNRLFLLETNDIHNIKKYFSLEAWINEGFEKNRYFKIKSHLKSTDGNENIYVSGHVGDFENRKFKVNYKENFSLLGNRFNTKISYLPTIEPSDHLLLFRYSFTDFNKFSDKDQLRILELSCSNFTFDSKFILSNDEIVLLKTLSGRQGISLEIIERIISEDLSYKKATIDLEKLEENINTYPIISEDRFDFLTTCQIIKLIPSGKINDKGDHLYNIEVDKTFINEPDLIKNSRLFFSGSCFNGNNYSLHEFQKYLNLFSKENNLNSFANLKDHFLNDANNKTISNLTNSFPLKIIDYTIYVNTRLSKPLNAREMDRLDTLKLIGRDPHVPLNSNLFTSSPKSFRLKKEQALVFNKAFVDFYKINPSHIEFINKFKQVSEDDLLKLGMKKVDLMRLAKGIDSEIFGEKIVILNTEKIFDDTGRALTYYSIQHKGTVSGRAILETYYPDTKIFSRTQSKQELLVHDLKVVSCVLEVIDEYEKMGYRILEIKNESTQYSETKTGKSNSERHDGPAFMDAQIIFEHQETKYQYNGGSGGSKITVAVEYGNYITKRMQSKIDNAHFDIGYVFANQNTTQRYINKISTSKIVHFRTM